MTRIAPFASPFLLGFDEIERMMDRIAKNAGDPYPPYNIERLHDAPGADDGARLRITLAVAGFEPDELSVEVEGSTLTISGDRNEEAERVYLHRGIAARRFERRFVLAEGMQVVGASLENGLLAIDLERPQPSSVVRRIPVVQRA